MNSRVGRGLNGRRIIARLSRYIMAGCLSLTMTLGNCINASGARQVNKGAVNLETGKPIERPLKEGETHTYQVSLGVNQFLRVVADQRGKDVVLSLFGPDNKKIADSDIPIGTEGEESISIISDTAGSYRLEVGWMDDDVYPGRYEIKIEEMRPATPQDGARVAAERGFSQAEELRLQATAESYRKAIQNYEEALPIFRSTGDRHKEAVTLRVTGYVYLLIGERRKTLECHYQALPIFRSLGLKGAEASTLTEIGEAYDRLGEPRKALDYYNQALPIHRSLGYKLAEARTLNNIGAVYNMRGEKQKALDHHNQALALNRSMGGKREEAMTLSWMGEVYETMGETQKALDLYNQALPIFRSMGDKRLEATTLGSMAVVHIALGERQKALDLYNQSLALNRSIGNRRGEAMALQGIGATYSALGEMQTALDYYSQALPIFRSIGDKRLEAIVLHGIAAVYNLLGEKQTALDYHNQALPIFRSISDRRAEAIVLTSIGAIYNSLGERQKALDYHNQALPMLRSTGDRRMEAIVLSRTGTVYHSLGEMRKALDLYNQALPIIRSVGDIQEEAVTYDYTGRVYVSLGEKQKALDYYNQALPLYRSAGHKRGEAITLNNIGKVYYSLGEMQKAHDSYTQSLLLSRALRDLSLEAGGLYEMARVKLHQGDFLQARSKLESALSIVESLRVKVTSPELRTSYFASVQDYYDFYIDLLMRLHDREPKHGHDVQAFQASERARARSLLEMLIEGRADIRKGVDLALLERERSLQRLLDAKAERQTRLLSGRHTEQQAAELKKEIEQLLTQYQEVRSQIRAGSPRYAALTQPQPLTLDQIQRDMLDPETLLLEYALGDERGYVWAITSGSIESFVLPGREEVQKAAQRVYDLLTARNRRDQAASPARREARVKQAEADYNRASAELSRMILGPVARQLGKKRLLIVADGALSYVPFAALPAPAAQDRQRLLIAEHEIISLPSASSLAVLRKELAGRETAPHAAVVLADPVFDAGDARVQSSIKAGAEKNGASKPVQDAALMRSANEVGLADRGELPRLPFSRQEAEAIYALTRQAGVDGGGTKVALGFEASRETAGSPDLGRYRIVHFATHGLLNNEHPELSGIVLSLVDSRGNPQNGFFRLYDVYNMNLAAELVVLSACQTALGKQVRGEGLMGLTRGFMYAGTARVMASLWRVEDEATAEMMKKFYEGMIKDGQRPAAALRSAQVWMQRQKRWKAPYYWAGFILQGEWK